jgi:hypothetical protein
MTPVRLAVWSCVGLFLCAALPLCLSNYDHGRAFSDQLNYHYPTIAHFLNGGSFADYPSATTPGYHLLLAGFGRWVLMTEPALKLANSAVTAALLGLIAAAVARQVGNAAASIAMLLPMIFSIYVFPSGVWLLPDNLAWLTVFCLLQLALHFRDSWRWYLTAALGLVAAVLVRQSNLWLCAVVLVAAWSGESDSRRHSRSGAGPAAQAPTASVPAAARMTQLASVPVSKLASVPVSKLASVPVSELASVPVPRFARLARAALAILPAFAVLAYFIKVWHGVTPPSFAEKHAAANLAAVPFFFCVLAFYSLFYLPLAVEPAQQLLRRSSQSRYAVYLGGLGALLASLATPTDWNPAEGRVSGLWALAKALPQMHHRSLGISVLATLGGMIAVAWWLMAKPRTRPIIAAAAVGFVAAQSTSHFVYERYYAGLIFLLILQVTAELLGERAGTAPRWSLAGPVTFTLFNAAVLTAGLYAG